MSIRKELFKIINKKDYLEIERNIKTLDENLFSPKKINSERLDVFLTEISKTSDYYKDYNSLNIKDYPIMNKKTLSHNLSNIMTIQNEEEQKYFVRKTSGSYGTPFKFIVNKTKILSQRSQVLFFGRWSNFDVGTKHLYLKSIEPNKINEIFKNQYVLKPEKIDGQWLKNSLKRLSKVRPEVLIGYPSSIEMLAKEINRNHFSIDFVKGIITSGETLTQSASDEIHKAFNAKPFSRYSTEELGVLGNTLQEGNNIILNQVDFYIEILDSNNQPVKNGEVGRVIVTDFHSHITPLIRYETGDLAKVSRYDENLVVEIEHLEGRLIETLYTTEGSMLTPFSINVKMKGYKNVEQFQFIQETRFKYTLNIVPIEEPVRGEYLDIIKYYEHLLGPEAIVTLKIVSEIKSLPSGKRPYIINRLNDSTFIKENSK